ncbi:MAG: sigma 54-interacting transcriptional regulator [Polyangiaceae bacterium]
MVDDTERLRLERDLFLRLLELGARDDLAPFLEDALSLIVSATSARQGYLELSSAPAAPAAASSKQVGAAGAPAAPATPAAPRFWMQTGFSDAELSAVRRDLSTGIVGEAIATGRTISTASAIDDPRFAANASVQAGKIRAVLCAPIAVASGQPLGVLYLAGRSSPGPFPEADRLCAEIFARHLAPLADRLLARETDDGAADHTAVLRARLRVDDAGGEQPLDSVAGKSRALAEVLRQIVVAAPVPIAVLITGESGTGKTAIARALHQSSPRGRGPFVEVNCAAIPEALFESELFGAEKGAHSTATRRVEGKVDAARGGTLFLDEVGETPLLVQGKLLQFLQSKRYYRLGSSAPLEADVRVVAATNQNLEELVAQKRFREDLYYRLNVLPVHVPPLRDRAEDVGPIAERIVQSLGLTHGRSLALSRAARIALAESEWPGNVRQLENTLARAWAVAFSEDSMTIEPRHVFPDRPAEAEEPDAATYQDATRRFQARFLREALEASGWNVSETARRIGVARSHLNDLIKVFGLSRKDAAAREPARRRGA